MKPITLPGIDSYAECHTTPDSPVLDCLTADTRRLLDKPQMMCGPVVGRVLQMLVHAVQPQLVLEIGTFSGYSALSMAAALPPGGRIITCERDQRCLELARQHISASPYADLITIEHGPALPTVQALVGPVDLVFLDADKTGYLDYVEAVLPKLSPRGLIAADNTLWNGDVLHDISDDPDAEGLRKFNAVLAADSRVSCVLLTVRDGLTLIRKA